MQSSTHYSEEIQEHCHKYKSLENHSEELKWLGKAQNLPWSHW